MTATVAPEPAAPPRGDPAPPAARLPWLVLAVVFLASVAAVMAQFAAPPLMPLIMAGFGVDVAQSSSLMSVFSITGLVLALPAGLILSRFGAVVTGAVAMLAVVAGSALGALAPDFGILLVSRLVQGVGVGLIGVVAPAVVAATFPPERRGLPMGIWAMWVPLGGVVMYNLAPALGAAGGWPAAWWFAAVVGAVALVAWVAVLAMCLPARRPGGPRPPSMRTALAGREIWVLSAVFGLFALSASGVNTFMPTFLTAERGFDLAAASSTASLVLVGAAVGSLAGGVVSDRLGSRRLVFTFSAVGLGLLWLLPFSVDPGLLPLVLLLIGLVSGMLPTAVFASVPEVMPDPRLTGAGMGAVMLGQNAGFVVGPLVFAAILGATSWVVAGYAFAVVSLVGAAVGWRSRVR